MLWGRAMDNLISKISSLLFAPFIIVVMLQVWIENQEDESANAGALEEALQYVLIVDDPSTHNPAVEGKPVFVHGPAHSRMLLGDNIFNIANKNRVRMHRKVEYYQWVEFRRELEPDPEGKHGPRRRYREVEYTYQKEWVKDPVDSSGFKYAHENGPVALKVKDSELVSEHVAVGAYALNSDQVGRLGPVQHYKLENYTLPEALATRASHDERYVYISTPGKIPAPGSPEIGDVRVSWDYVGDNLPVGIMALCKDGTLVPYQGKEGQVDILQQGTFNTLEELLAQKTKTGRLDNIMRLIIMVGVLACCFRWLMVWVQDRETEFWEKMRISGLWVLSLYLALETTLLLQAAAWIKTDGTYAGILLGVCVAVHIGYTRYRSHRLQREEEEDDTTLDLG